MFRKLAILVILVIVIAGAYGAAASLVVQGGAIQAGVDATLTCDNNGVKVLGWGLETDDSKVYSVRIGDVDPACVGNKMHVRVFNGSGVPLGPQVTISNLPEQPDDGYRFGFSPAIDAESIAQIKVWIDGPNP
jgi:hypothetical protein